MAKPGGRGGGSRGVRQGEDLSRQFGALALEMYQPLGDLIGRDRWKGRITELSINGPADVFVRIAGQGYVRVPAREVNFITEAWMDELLGYFAAAMGIRWSYDMPLLACRTPDGHRFICLIGNNVESHLASSIRVKRMVNATYEDFEVTHQWRDLIDRTVDDGKALALSGSTGSGKTTFLNMLCKKIKPEKRVITAEDTRELEIANENKVHLIVSRTEASTRITYAHIIDTVLRLNPHVFLMGELSIANAFWLLQAMDTGHEGAMTTAHANSAMDFLRGFRRRVALGGGANVGTEVAELMDFFAENVHLVIQIVHKEGADNTERRVVTECATPKELLNSRTARKALFETERDIDRHFDVIAAREALLAANAGLPLSQAQEESLRTWAVLANAGLFGGAPRSRRAAALGGGIGQDGTLDLEDQTIVEAGARGLLERPDPGKGPIRAEVSGDGRTTLREAAGRHGTEVNEQ